MKQHAMADNYLERRMEIYAQKKEAYLKKKRHIASKCVSVPKRPDDEAL